MQIAISQLPFLTLTRVSFSSNSRLQPGLLPLLSLLTKVQITYQFCYGYVVNIFTLIYPVRILYAPRP